MKSTVDALVVGLGDRLRFLTMFYDVYPIQEWFWVLFTLRISRSLHLFDCILRISKPDQTRKFITARKSLSLNTDIPSFIAHAPHVSKSKSHS